MAIAQSSQQFASTGKGVISGLKSCVGGTSKCWTRSLAVGSLVTGTILLARGKRAPGLVAAVAGAAIVILEDPKEITALWNNLPAYLDTGKRLIDRVEGLVEEMSTQGEKVRAFLEKTAEKRI